MRLILQVFVLLVVSGAAGAKPSVTALRIGQHPDKTRIVMEMSEEPAYRVFALANPYRVVIDLSEAEWRIPSPPPQMPAAPIADLRYGQFAPGMSRIVLDAEAPVIIEKVLVLPPTGRYPHRLVVDIKKVSRHAYKRADLEIIESKRPFPKGDLAKSAPAKADDRITVVIDPGHGGVDPGAIGVSRTYEKAITLAYAKALKRELESRGKYRVLLTRDRDVFVKLDDRWRFAREAGANLFLSLHADSHHSHKLRGASVFTLSDEASDEVAKTLAESANKSDLIAGVDLSQHNDEVSNILLDLTRRETANFSARFASMLVRNLGNETRLLGNPHRFAGFVVLKAHDIPSALVEIGFLSNPSDERRIRSKVHRRRVTRAIAQAIERYFKWQQALR